MTPAPSPSSPAPPATELAYKVSNNGSVSFPIRPGGHVEQPFTSDHPFVHKIAVNAAWDPARVTGSTFSMDLEIRDQAGHRLAGGRVGVTSANRDTDIAVTLGSVRLVPGRVYRLWAVNTSREDLGIRLGNPRLPESRVKPVECALVVGHADDARPSYIPDGPACALNGFIEVGSSPAGRQE
jgi:hypothetical protein